MFTTWLKWIRVNIEPAALYYSKDLLHILAIDNDKCEIDFELLRFWFLFKMK